MPYFSHDNLNFYFEEYDSGVPLLFSHGLAGNLEQIKESIGSVPGFRLILYDNRGHGKTVAAGPVDSLNFTTMANDAAALLDWLSIENAVIGGVSMGAGVALAFSLEHPHRVRALVLARPAWLNQPEPPNLAMFPIIAGLIENAGIPRAQQLFERSEAFAKWKEQYPQAINSVTGFFAGPSSEAMSVTYRAIPRSVPYRTAEALARVAVPTLILANRQDPIHPFEYAETLAQALPNSCLREFPSKSEGLQQHVDGLRSCVRGFLAQLDLRAKPN